MCSKNMPYRPGTMKRGPNDTRHVVWALDKFFFFHILVCIIDYLLYIYIYISFLLSSGQGRPDWPGVSLAPGQGQGQQKWPWPGPT